jgi:two-component system sensor histidine kinase VanS
MTFTFLLVCVFAYIQIFVISRMYLTTTFTSQKIGHIYGNLDLISNDFNSAATNQFSSKSFIDIQSGLRVLQDYEKRDNAFYLIISDNYKLLYTTVQAKKTLGGSCLNSICNTIKENSESGTGYITFRITGDFNLPTKYLAASFHESDVHVIEPHSYYFVAVTREAYTNRNTKALRDYFISVMLIALLAALALSLLVSYVLTRPIRKINRAALKMAKMDFSEKCDIRTSDEIGNLAHSLNFLSDKLDAALNELYAANEKLKSDLDLQRELDNMKKKFIAAVSHELKTPLTLIKGYTESVRDHVIDEADMPKAQDMIIAQTDRMDRLIQDMLDLSVMEAGGYTLQNETFTIDDLLEEVASHYGLVMKERKLEFHFDAACKDVQVSADRFRIGQVLSNFLNNAIAHTEDGRSIPLISRHDEQSVTVAVENEGTHIAEDDRKRIWEKFYRADTARGRKTGGTGLGLSICKNILELHGASYGTENTQMGMRFYFTLNKAV